MGHISHVPPPSDRQVYNSMNIALFSAKKYDEVSFGKHIANFPGTHVEYFSECANAANVEARLSEATNKLECVCVFVNDVISKDVIDVLKKHGIEAILCRCAGFDRVDVAYAEDNGVQVARVPAYSPYAVAEHAVSLLCTLNRKLHIAYNRVSEGNFSIDGLVGMDLFGKTVGVIGTGKIGQILIDIMLGFGCKILCNDLYPSKDVAAKPNCKYVEVDELYKVSDIISLHSPLLPSTKHMINKESVAKMKEGVIILNAARGGLVDSHALMDGIKSGKVRGAGLDVYEHEAGLFFNDCSDTCMHLDDSILLQLSTCPRVVMSSHQAFLTEEALEAIATVTLENAKEICDGKKGKDLKNWVSKEMLVAG